MDHGTTGVSGFRHPSHAIECPKPAHRFRLSRPPCPLEPGQRRHNAVALEPKLRLRIETEREVVPPGARRTARVTFDDGKPALLAQVCGEIGGVEVPSLPDGAEGPAGFRLPFPECRRRAMARVPAPAPGIERRRPPESGRPSSCRAAAAGRKPALSPRPMALLVLLARAAGTGIIAAHFRDR